MTTWNPPPLDLEKTFTEVLTLHVDAGTLLVRGRFTQIADATRAERRRGIAGRRVAGRVRSRFAGF